MGINTTGPVEYSSPYLLCRQRKYKEWVERKEENNEHFYFVITTRHSETELDHIWQIIAIQILSIYLDPVKDMELKTYLK